VDNIERAEKAESEAMQAKELKKRADKLLLRGEQDHAIRQKRVLSLESELVSERTIARNAREAVRHFHKHFGEVKFKEVLGEELASRDIGIGA
jgi:hypothetical protein